MRSPLLRLLAVFVLSVIAGRAVHAQGSFFTSLSGTVVDTQGAVIPGADVKVKNNGTGIENNVVTGSDGSFTNPSLPGGVYAVTVSLQGFLLTEEEWQDDDQMLGIWRTFVADARRRMEEREEVGVL